MDVSVGIERQHLHVDSPDDEGRVQEAQQITVDRASRHLHSPNAGAINDEVKCYIRGGVLCP
jgi:hypothetical protein